MLERLISKELFVLSTTIYELSWGNIKEEPTDLQMYKKENYIFLTIQGKKKGWGREQNQKCESSFPPEYFPDF